MQERGAKQFGEQSDGYHYDEEDVPRRSGGYGPQTAAPAPRGPGGPRTGLVVGAVVVAAALGAGAFAAWHASNGAKDNPTVQAGATSASSLPTSPSSAPSTAATTSAPSTAATTSAASPAAAVADGDAGYVQPSAAAQVAGDFYGYAQFALANPGSVLPADGGPKNDFVSATVAARYWDAASSKPTAAALCGATSPNLAVVSGGVESAAVALSAKGVFSAQAANVTMDLKTGKISAIACVPAAAPSYPGTAAILARFAKYPATPMVPATHSYASKSADGPSNVFDFDSDVCGQYVPTTWVFYAPIGTPGGMAWSFAYDGGGRQFQVFTDPADGSYERTLCDGFPAIPAPDRAAAGKSVQGAPDPAGRLVDGFFAAYIYERSQVSGGAMPADEMAPYFTSTAAYTAARNGTGKNPFLCATKAPDTVLLGTPEVSGSTEVFEATAGFQPTPDKALVPYGKEKIVVDLTTMKIQSITCG